jgi:hypothetical protein
VFDVVFALDRRLNVVVLLEVNQPLDAIPFRKSGDQAVAMFVDSSNEVVRDPTYKMPLGALARM